MSFWRDWWISVERFFPRRNPPDRAAEPSWSARIRPSFHPGSGQTGRLSPFPKSSDARRPCGRRWRGNRRCTCLRRSGALSSAMRSSRTSGARWPAAAFSRANSLGRGEMSAPSSSAPRMKRVSFAALGLRCFCGRATAFAPDFGLALRSEPGITRGFVWPTLIGTSCTDGA